MSFKKINGEITSCNVGGTGYFKSVDCSTYPGYTPPFTCAVNITKRNVIICNIYLKSLLAVY
jgi:hypothetical protein